MLIVNILPKEKANNIKGLFMAVSDKKIEKIEDNIDDINQHLAQCRMNDQKLDHDILIKEHARITTLDKELAEYKNEHAEKHAELREERKATMETIETISGNLNQSMMFIKDLQKGARIRLGLWTTILAGVITTILATLIIYLFSNLPHNNNNESITNNEILLKISNRLDQNSKEIESVKRVIIRDDNK